MNALSSHHPRHSARERALQFLYQCEREKIFHYNPATLRSFAEYFSIKDREHEYLEKLVSGTLTDLSDLDRRIKEVAENWRIERMCSIDRGVLRLAVWELIQGNVPKKVVINEAVEIAKKFGTEHSGRFVNGILDRIARSLPGNGNLRKSHAGVGDEGETTMHLSN